MSRCVWFLMVAGLFAAIGCEGKLPDQPSGKVTSEDVRRDASQAVNTAVEFSNRARTSFRRNSKPDSRSWTPKSRSSARRVATSRTRPRLIGIGSWPT